MPRRSPPSFALFDLLFHISGFVSFVLGIIPRFNSYCASCPRAPSQADANIAAIRGRNNADAEERRRAKAEKEEYDRLHLLCPMFYFVLYFLYFAIRPNLAHMHRVSFTSCTPRTSSTPPITPNQNYILFFSSFSQANGNPLQRHGCSCQRFQNGALAAL